jgi:Arc/MetJ-type ribon-helix-helix transcriptional regulator
MGLWARWGKALAAAWLVVNLTRALTCPRPDISQQQFEIIAFRGPSAWEAHGANLATVTALQHSRARRHALRSYGLDGGELSDACHVGRRLCAPPQEGRSTCSHEPRTVRPWTQRRAASYRQATTRGGKYDPSMSDTKKRITITVDPHLASYAEHLVQAGKAESVSAAFNEAMATKRQRDQHALSKLRERASQADPARVERMRRHIDAQARQAGFEVAAGE